MTDREKLVELLYGHSIDTKEDAEYVADHLLANGVTVQEWISVEDRLPEPDEYVLCFYKDWCGKRWQTVGSVQSYSGMWGLDIDPDNDLVDEVTHWMPLPEPPEEG